MGKRRRRRWLIRRVHSNTSISPFVILLQSQCEQSIIAVAGFDHAPFVYTLKKFELLYKTYTPYSTDGFMKILGQKRLARGRSRTLDAMRCLRLPLAWHRTRGSTFVLNVMFAVTESVCRHLILFSRCFLTNISSTDKNAVTSMPTEEDFEQYKAIICTKYPSLSSLYGTADGLKLYLEEYWDGIVQNMVYNGWKSDQCVGAVLVLVPSEWISSAIFNAPGCMYNSQIS